MSSAEEGLKIGADLSMWVFIASLVFLLFLCSLRCITVLITKT